MPQSWKSAIPNLDLLLEFEQCPPSEIKGMGCRFFDNDLVPYLSPSFVSLLHRFRGLLVYQAIGVQNPKISAEGDDDMISVLEHEFIELKYEETMSPLQECFEEAIWLFNVTNLHKCYALAFIGSLLAPMKALLEQHFEDLLAVAPDALLWMLHLGVTTSVGHHSAQADWFSSHMASVAHILEARSWLQVKALLQGFFFIDRPSYH